MKPDLSLTLVHDQTVMLCKYDVQSSFSMQRGVLIYVNIALQTILTEK